LTKVEPSEGPLIGGTPLTLTGTNFRATSTVHVGEVLCTDLVWVSATTLQCNTPAALHAGAVDMRVHNEPDQQEVSLRTSFTYKAPVARMPKPTITRIHPSGGPVMGGSLLTLEGTNFEEGGTILVNGVFPGHHVTVVDANTLTFLMPAGSFADAGGQVDITFQSPSKKKITIKNGFRYNFFHRSITEAAHLIPKISALFDDGKYQEAIWVCERRGHLEAAHHLKELLASLLKSRTLFEEKLAGGADPTKKVVEFSAAKAVFKAKEVEAFGGAMERNGDSEIAAYLLDQLLDLQVVPMTVPIAEGSVQFYVEGATPYRFSRPYAPNTLPPDPVFSHVQVLDYLIGNPDRYNGANLLMLPDAMGHLTHEWPVAIDNGSGWKVAHGGYFAPDGALKVAAFSLVDNTIIRDLVADPIPMNITGGWLRGNGAFQEETSGWLRMQKLYVMYDQSNTPESLGLAINLAHVDPRVVALLRAGDMPQKMGATLAPYVDPLMLQRLTGGPDWGAEGRLQLLLRALGHAGR